MLSFAPNIRILLHARPTDMRKSFDGLCCHPVRSSRDSRCSGPQQYMQSLHHTPA